MLQKFSDVILECYQFADMPTRPTISTGSKVISTWRRVGSIRPRALHSSFG